MSARHPVLSHTLDSYSVQFSMSESSAVECSKTPKSIPVHRSACFVLLCCYEELIGSSSYCQALLFLLCLQLDPLGHEACWFLLR